MDDYMGDSSLQDVSPGDYSAGDDIISNDIGEADRADNQDETITVHVNSDDVLPVYSSVDDDVGNPVAYAVSFNEDEVLLLSDAEETKNDNQQFTQEEILLQINDNLVSAAGLVTSFFGAIIGLLCAFEFLKIWLQS